jgi:hypothetical protein
MSFQERSAALREKMEEPLPESWIAKEAGEELVGTFVRLDQGRTDAFGAAWIVVVETEKGEHKSVWLFHQALLNEFRRVRPVPGELIGIRYGGKKPVKNQTPGRASSYHDWKVVVDRAQNAATTDWAVLGSDGGDVFAPTVEDELKQTPEDDLPF